MTKALFWLIIIATIGSLSEFYNSNNGFNKRCADQGGIGIWNMTEFMCLRSTAVMDRP